MDRTGEQAGSPADGGRHDPPDPAGRPAADQVSRRMRDLLTLASAARVGMARRLKISVNDLQSVEHLMTASMEGAEPPALGPGDIARALGVSTAASTQSLHRLEASGHLRRRPHPHDGRRHVIEVTEHGAGEVLEVLSPLLRHLAAQAEQLSPAERLAVVKFLDGQRTAYRRFLAELAPPQHPRTPGGDDLVPPGPPDRE